MRTVAFFFGMGLLSVTAVHMVGQSQNPVLRPFDVASIKPNKATACVQFHCGVTTITKSGRLIIQYYSLTLLVRTAFGVGVDEIVGGPEWRDNDRFDIDAKAEAPVPGEIPKTLKSVGIGKLVG